jgi:hypothetical protein
MIVSYQSILIGGSLPPWHAIGGLAALAALSFFPGFWVFQQIKRVLADNV